MAARTRATVAGSIISAVADICLILVLGWYAEWGERHDTHTTAGTTGEGPGQVGGGLQRLSGCCLPCIG